MTTKKGKKKKNRGQITRQSKKQQNTTITNHRIHQPKNTNNIQTRKNHKY